MNPHEEKARHFYCPACLHVMTEEESKGYRGCPTDKPGIVTMHLAQHVELNLPSLLAADAERDELKKLLVAANTVRHPTHRCRECGALWIAFPDSWSLFSPKCGKCCDNVAMGQQIETIGVSDFIRIALEAVKQERDQLRTANATLHKVALAARRALTLCGIRSEPYIPPDTRVKIETILSEALTEAEAKGVLK